MSAGTFSGTFAGTFTLIPLSLLSELDITAAVDDDDDDDDDEEDGEG